MMWQVLTARECLKTQRNKKIKSDLPEQVVKEEEKEEEHSSKDQEDQENLEVREVYEDQLE